MYRINRFEAITPIERIKGPTKEDWEKLRKRLDAPSTKNIKLKKTSADYLEEAMGKRRKEQPSYLGQNVDFLY